jgi:hypothetical protein
LQIAGPLDSRLSIAWYNRAARNSAQEAALRELEDEAERSGVSPTRMLQDATLGPHSPQHGRRSVGSRWRSPYAVVKSAQKVETDGLEAVRKQSHQSVIGL